MHVPMSAWNARAQRRMHASCEPLWMTPILMGWHSTTCPNEKPADRSIHVLSPVLLLTQQVFERAFASRGDEAVKALPRTGNSALLACAESPVPRRRCKLVTHAAKRIERCLSPRLLLVLVSVPSSPPSRPRPRPRHSAPSMHAPAKPRDCEAAATVKPCAWEGVAVKPPRL